MKRRTDVDIRAFRLTKVREGGFDSVVRTKRVDFQHSPESILAKPTNRSQEISRSAANDKIDPPEFRNRGLDGRLELRGLTHSAWAGMHSWPVSLVSSAALDWSRSSLRPIITAFAPCCITALVISLHIPLPPPVQKRIFPLKMSALKTEVESTYG